MRRAQRRLRRPGGALQGPEWQISRGRSPPGDEQEEDNGLRLTLLAYRDPQHIPGAGLLPGRSQPSPPPSYLLRPPSMAGFPVPATLPSPGSRAAVVSKQTTQNSPHGGAAGNLAHPERLHTCGRRPGCRSRWSAVHTRGRCEDSEHKGARRELQVSLPSGGRHPSVRRRWATVSAHPGKAPI